MSGELVCKPEKSGVPLHYKRGGKGYVLTRTYVGDARIPGAEQFSHRRTTYRLDMGKIVADVGTSWDGASGPTWDTCSDLVGSTFRASLEHDLGYGIGRGLSFALRKDRERFRKAIDNRFRDLLRADGMPFWRTWYYYCAVRWFGEPAFNGVKATRSQILRAKIVAPCMVSSLQQCGA